MEFGYSIFDNKNTKMLIVYVDGETFRPYANLQNRGHEWPVHQNLRVDSHCQPSSINRSNKGISAISNK